MTLDFLSRDSYLQLLNAKFNVHFDQENIVEAELIEVSDLKTRPQQEQFSTVFLIPADAPVVQGLYEIEHPQTGKFELFLVPFGADEKGTKFEAVFNRLV